MNEDMEIREQLVLFARRAYKRGLVHGTGGNISARLHDDKMIIKASGLSLMDTATDNLMTVDIRSYDWKPNGDYIPSKEYKFHAEIYRQRSEIEAILHVHPPFATAYAVKGEDIPRVTDAGFIHSAFPCVPFAPGGSEELKDLIAVTLEQNPECQVMLLEKHGIIAMGSDVVTAYNLADLAESIAHIAYITLGIE